MPSENHHPDIPERLLAIAVRCMPSGRSEWGAAMLAELALLPRAAERWRFALGCARTALFPPSQGEIMRNMTIGGAALLSSLLVAPLAFLEFRFNTSDQRSPADLLVLFGLLWLLPAVFFTIAGSVIRTIRGGNVALMASGRLYAGAALLLLLAFVWGSLVADQLPCFLGSPNCD